MGNKYKSLPFLMEHTKYKKEIPTGPGSLESQIVRICDKISYFISDLEDGLRLNIIQLDHLKRFDLFKENITSRKKPSFDYNAQFFMHRNKLLTALVNSIIKESSKNLNPVSLKKNKLLILPDENVKSQIDEIYSGIQKEVLFEHFLIKRANERAKHIVKCLLCWYWRHPELIPWHYRRKYHNSNTNNAKKYSTRLKELYGINIKNVSVEFETVKLRIHRSKENIDCKYLLPKNNDPKSNNINLKSVDAICVKDYVAGMTDRFAELRFKSIDCPTAQKVCSIRSWQDPLWSVWNKQ